MSSVRKDPFRACRTDLDLPCESDAEWFASGRGRARACARVFVADEGRAGNDSRWVRAFAALVGIDRSGKPAGGLIQRGVGLDPTRFSRFFTFRWEPAREDAFVVHAKATDGKKGILRHIILVADTL